MEGTPQNGIYFEKGSTPGKYFGIIFLRTVLGSSALEVGNSLSRLWRMLSDLKLPSSEGYSRFNHSAPANGISSLLAFGPKLFDLPGIGKSRPKGFVSGTLFQPPNQMGGGQILKDSDIFYEESVITNNIEDNEVAIQFVGDDDTQISIAIVETYRMLSEESLTPTRFYTGFRRPDQRNWLGFHDGLSNIPTKFRRKVIFIDEQNFENKWTNNGSYMSFMRVNINIKDWWRTSQFDQEIIIGREKETGCPIRDIDAYGNIVHDPFCPITGTKDITEKGNEKYRESTKVYSKYSKLNLSHLSTMRSTVDANQKNQMAVFRQGYEFLESDRRPPGFRVGLNFVSFQNDPDYLFKILTNWKTYTSKTADNVETVPLLNKFINVSCAAIFFVPPIAYHEDFPGSSLFQDSTRKSIYKR